MPSFDLASREAWLWLGGSLLLAGLWTNLVWLFSPWVEAGRSPEDSESLAQGLRLLYYLGLPFAALFWGYDAVITRFFGLQRLVLPTSSALGNDASINANWLDWACDVGWAVALGLGSWGLLLVAGWVRRRAVADLGGPRLTSKAPAWETLREALYHEVHWTFYRNAPIVALGLYWGAWAGLALAALEALANPVWRKRLGTPGGAPALLLRAAMAVVSSLLFLRTQNLWLAVLLHWGVTSGLRVLYPAASGVTPEGVGTGA
jgi:hypothetical protein